MCEKNEKYGYIDKNGKEVIKCQYEYGFDFSEGFALVRRNGKYGYIDRTGKEVIACRYDRTSDFHDGFAFVEINEKSWHIDKEGKPFIEKIFLEKLHDVLKVPKNAKVVNTYIVYAMNFYGNQVLFSSKEEQENFMKEISFQDENEKTKIMVKK